MIAKQILEALQKKPKISLKEISELCQINPFILKKMLQQLSFEELVTNIKEYCSDSSCESCANSDGCGLAELRYGDVLWVITSKGEAWLSEYN